MWTRSIILALCILMFASLTALCAVQQAVVVGVNRYADEAGLRRLVPPFRMRRDSLTY